MPFDTHTLFGHQQALAGGPWRDPLALLLASTGEGIYGVDLDGLCVFINPAGASLIGYEPDELRGRNMHNLTYYARADALLRPTTLCHGPPMQSGRCPGVPLRQTAQRAQF